MINLIRTAKASRFHVLPIYLVAVLAAAIFFGLLTGSSKADRKLPFEISYFKFFVPQVDDLGTWWEITNTRHLPVDLWEIFCFADSRDHGDTSCTIQYDGYYSSNLAKNSPLDGLTFEIDGEAKFWDRKKDFFSAEMTIGEDRISFWIDEAPWPGYGENGQDFHDLGIDRRFLTGLDNGSTLYVHRRKPDGTITAPTGFDLAPLRQAMSIVIMMIDEGRFWLPPDYLPLIMADVASGIWWDRLTMATPPWEMDEQAKTEPRLIAPEDITVICPGVPDIDVRINKLYQRSPEEVRRIVRRLFVRELEGNRSRSNNGWQKSFPNECESGARKISNLLGFWSFLLHVAEDGPLMFPQWRISGR